MLSCDFTIDDFLARYGETALLLFCLEENGNLIVATDERKMLPRPGQKLVALVDDQGA